MPALTVAHVAHTTEAGGAELALARLLNSPCRAWDAALVVPRTADLGVFDGVDPARTTIVAAGRPQPPGASRAGIAAAVPFAARLLAQAAVLRRQGPLRAAAVLHANSTRASVAAALALSGRRTPLVVHLRDRVDAASMGRLGHEAFRRLVVPRTTAFIANSTSTADTVRPLLRGDQFVEVIPSPIGMERLAVPPAPHTGPVRIGMVARLDPWKGQELLLRAFAAAGIDGAATLRLIGGAPFGHEAHRDDLETLAQELGLRHVEFAGFRDDVEGEIDRLDVGVQYSTRPEPLGQNVLQYLARGKAVVAAAEGGPTEWIADGGNGLLVPPRDTAALAGALRRLVDDVALRRSLAAAAVETPLLPTDCAIAEAHGRVFARAAAGSH